MVTAAAIQGCVASLLPVTGGTLTGPLTLAAPAGNTVRNGSLTVGDSDFFRSSFQTRGPQVALFSRVGSATTDKAVVHSFYLVNHPGGAGHVIPNMLVETSVNSSPADGIWGFLSTLASNAGGGNGGATGHVAGYWQTVRTGVPIPHTTLAAPSNGSSVRVADVSHFATGYTKGVGYPVSPEHPLAVTIGGGRHEVTGVRPDAKGASSGPGVLTLSRSLPPTEARPGTPVQGEVVGANLWGGVIEYHEQVDLPSSRSGMGQTLELDWVGNNVDDANARTFVSAVLGKNAKDGADVEIGNVIGVWPGANATAAGGASIKRGFWVGLPFSEAVIDTRKATQRRGANAIWLAEGHRIALDASGKHYLDAEGGVLAYRTDSGTGMSIAPSGDAGFGGSVAAKSFRVGADQVLGARQTGWPMPVGRVARERLNANWEPEAGKGDRREEMRAVADQLRAVTRTLAALITDLSRHGLIGP
jgi:hypothetical protein